MKYLYLVLALLLVTGCADKHKLIKSSDTSVKLETKKKVYVAVPKNGTFNNRTYKHSGKYVADAVLKAFSPYNTKVEIGQSYQSFDVAVSNAKAYDYMIYSTILHWEDRATEWNGLPDRMSVKVDVIDTKTKQLISSVTVEGTSGLGTFGGDHPQDLLKAPLEEFANSLY